MLAYDKTIKELVIREMRKSKADMSNKVECSRFIDAVIKKIENKLGVEFQVLKGEIAIPPQKHFGKNFPYSMMTAATCYAVRDVDTITVTNIKDVTA